MYLFVCVERGESGSTGRCEGLQANKRDKGESGEMQTQMKSEKKVSAAKWDEEEMIRGDVWGEGEGAKARWTRFFFFSPPSLAAGF